MTVSPERGRRARAAALTSLAVIERGYRLALDPSVPVSNAAELRSATTAALRALTDSVAARGLSSDEAAAVRGVLARMELAGARGERPAFSMDQEPGVGPKPSRVTLALAVMVAAGLAIGAIGAASRESVLGAVALGAGSSMVGGAGVLLASHLAG